MFNQDKLEAAILFFTSNRDIVDLGKTKLMKLLYFADFEHFERYDVPITGATYGRLPKGPVPREALDVLKEMDERELLEISNEPVGNHVRERYIPLVDPDLSVFSAAERNTLNEVTVLFRKFTLTEIIERSHQEAPWLACSTGESIPYELAYYRNRYGAMDLDPDELSEMQSLEIATH